MATPIQESPLRSPLRDDHEQFRTQARRFVEREIRPFRAGWEEEGIVPASLWRKAGSEGLLNCMLPQPYGQGGDFGHSAVVIEELARVNARAPGFSVHSEIVPRGL